jgi:hypothetical protein
VAEHANEASCHWSKKKLSPTQLHMHKSRCLFYFWNFQFSKMNTMDNYESMPMQEFDIKGGICGGVGAIYKES